MALTPRRFQPTKPAPYSGPNLMAQPIPVAPGTPIGAAGMMPGYNPLYKPRTGVTGVSPELIASLQKSGLLATGEEDIANQVGAQVGLEYDPLEDQLRQGYDRLEAQLRRDVYGQHLFGQEGDRRLQAIYDQLNSRLQGGVGQIQALYQGAGQQVGQGYDAASAAAAQAAGGVRDRLMAEMQRLGLEQAAPAPLTELESQLAAQQAQLAGSRAGATGNLAGLGAGMTSSAVQGAMNAAQEGAQRRGDLVTQIQNALFGLQGQYGEKQADVLGELSSIQGQRGKAMAAGVSTEKQRRDEIKRQQEQQAWERAMQEKQFAEQQRQFNTQVSESRAARRLGGGGGGGSLSKWEYDVQKEAAMQPYRSNLLAWMDRYADPEVNRLVREAFAMGDWETASAYLEKAGRGGRQVIKVPQYDASGTKIGETNQVVEIGRRTSDQNLSRALDWLRRYYNPRDDEIGKVANLPPPRPPAPLKGAGPLQPGQTRAPAPPKKKGSSSPSRRVS